MNSSALRQRLAASWTRLLPLSRRVRRKMPGHFEQVRVAAADLDTAMGEIEARFLHVGNTLETTTTLGRDLVEHCEALIALSLGQGGGEITIATAAQHIWDAIEFVERNDQRMAVLIGQLTEANEQIRQTLKAERTLERTIAPLTVIQTLFRVESAGLPYEVQEMFHALGREIDRIRGRVESGFREKFQLIGEIHAILSRAITHVATEQKRAQESLGGLRRHLTDSLAAMKASYEKNRDRDTRLTSVSQGVAAETCKVVMALQLQDILSQKYQHTRKVLQEMAGSLGSLPSPRTEACQALRFIQQSGQIANAQLAAMAEELNKAGQTIGGGLQQINRLMDTLDGDCLAVRDLDSVTTGVDGAVQILLDSLADVRRLVSASVTHATEVHRTIAPIGGMTTNFTSFMRELSLEIHLIGLNAEVQAAHVGRGTGLEVLSARTSAISRETSQLSEGLAVQLDALTGGLDQVVVRFREIRDENNQFGVTLDAEITRDSALLHDYRDSALKVLLHISDQLPKLTAQTRSANEQADFSAVAAPQIATLQTVLAALVNAARSMADESGITVATQGLTDRFISSYTMRSQVEIHHAALGKPTGQVPDAATPAAPPDIELFGSDTPADAAASAPVTAAPAAVDLWDDSPVATPVAPSPADPTPVASGVDLWDEPAAVSSRSPEGNLVPGQRAA